MDRRAFLRLSGMGVAAGVTLALGGDSLSRHQPDPVFGVNFDSDDEVLSFEELSQMERRLDRVVDLLDLTHWHPSATQEDLTQWTSEAVFQTAAQGAVTNAIWPEEAIFVTPQSAYRAYNVLGGSDCKTYIHLNNRMLNEHADMYRSQGFIGSIFHEAVHIVQGKLCARDDEVNIENTAQIVMLENLAATSNTGKSKEAFQAFVWETEVVVRRAAYALALKEGRPEWFEALRSQVDPGALAIAGWEKEKRDDNVSEEKKSDIAMLYGYEPINRIVRAIRTNTGAISDLALPPVYVQTKQYSYKPVPRTFLMDDFAYAMGHLEDLAWGYKREADRG